MDEDVAWFVVVLLFRGKSVWDLTVAREARKGRREGEDNGEGKRGWEQGEDCTNLPDVIIPYL